MGGVFTYKRINSGKMPLHIIENGCNMLLIALILLIINGWRNSVLYSTVTFKQMEFCSLISVMI